MTSSLLKAALVAGAHRRLQETPAVRLVLLLQHPHRDQRPDHDHRALASDQNLAATPQSRQPLDSAGATAPFFDRHTPPLLTCTPALHATWRRLLPSCGSTGPSAGSCPQAGLEQRRRFIHLPSPQQLWHEFFSPSRAMTSYLMATNVVLTALTSWDSRLFSRLVQANWLVAKGEWWRLLTASFLHSGILHLAGNMLAIHYLGPSVEQLVNRTTFGVIYVSSAMAGGLAHYYFGSFGAAVLGSSGAIAGLFAAWVTYKLRNRAIVGFDEHDRSFVLQMVAINVVLSFAFTGTVAHMAHVGGLVGGATAMWLFGPRLVWRHGQVVDEPLLGLLKRLP